MEPGQSIALSSAKSNHFERYFQYAEAIISAFKGTQPFHLYLKNYFSSNKKHGSRDRKIITSLCYNYFRVIGGVSSEKKFKETFLLAYFLCETIPSPILNFYKPEWDASIQLPINEKLEIARADFDLNKVFHLGSELTHEIDFQKFCISFLKQSKLFIRIRPGFKASVIDKIKKANLIFEEINGNCLAFKNNEKVNSIINIDGEAVVQDINSQKIFNLLSPAINALNEEKIIWDCCAGAGGKSILAFDLFKKVNITVSDKRKNILENLEKRFAKVGITNYDSVLADLEKPFPDSDKSFDIIIADVPCTGSGTWARTPEQLAFFNRKEINKYVSLQRNIIKNAIPQLKENGYLLYITCSVFKKENEENVSFIEQNFPLKLVKISYLKGYEIQADTLFAALFECSSHLN